MQTTAWPTTEQIQALKEFAKIHGRNWKSVLRDAWMDGDYQGFENCHLLQQIRNTFGPGWLIRFVLPKDGNWAVFDRAEDAAAAEAVTDSSVRLSPPATRARRSFSDAKLNERIFIGVFPGGLSYADRKVERHGDYAPLGFLDYAKLELRFDDKCPEGMKGWIAAHARTIQARKGEQYQVSTSGQTITLGYRL